MCGEICDWTNRMGHLEKGIAFHSKCHVLYGEQWMQHDPIQSRNKVTESRRREKDKKQFLSCQLAS